jgi:ATP-dependent DNA helicase RecG
MTDSQPKYENLPALLKQGSGPDLHFFPEDAGLTDLAETLVALANGFGGRVILGVSPLGEHLQGLSDPEALVDLVFQACLLAEPVLVLPVPLQQTFDGKTALIVTVPDGLPHAYNLKGRYLARKGRQNVSIPARQLRELLVARGVLQFESRIPSDASLDDLDLEQIRAYLAEINRPDADWQQTLLQRGCLAADGEKLCPTYAALLLFGKHPQRWLPNATILAARFPGISFSDEFLRQDIAGTLPQQLRQAELFLQDNLRTVVRMVGLTHQDTPEYPYSAVRELLVNAVAHRDYNQQGDNIHLYLYADRLEIHSPGELPGPVNLKNLLNARFSRNAVIAQVLSDLGFVERLGYGLNRVVTVMRQHGMRAPQFEELGGSFRASLFAQSFTPDSLPDLSPYQDLDLNPRQQQLLGFLAQNKRITNSDYQELCPDVSPETLRRDFADLVQRNVLIKMGTKRATYYILK